MSFLHQIPMLRLLIPLIFGIVLAFYFPTQHTTQYYLFGALFFIYIIIISIKKLNAAYSFRWIYGVAVYFLFLTMGYCVTNLQSSKIPQQLNKLNNQVIIGQIIDPPNIKEKIVKCEINVMGIQNNQNWNSSEGKAVVFFQKNSKSENLSMGDYISFVPNFNEIEASKNPLEFDYKRYLSFHLIREQTYIKSSHWLLLEKANNSTLYVLADVLRLKMVNLLASTGLSGNELGVASALVLGYKSNIEAQLKSAYSNSGTMHVLAVSGLHVAVVFMIFNVLLKFLEKITYGNLIKGIILLFVLWFYALITGLSPSVLRSAAMFSFVVIAGMINRRNNFFNTLSASALLLLLVNPYLIFDIGFQLSYIAVVGIVLIQPWFDKLYAPSTWFGKYIWDLVTVSMAAQIATFPLGLYYFHQFPNYFLLSNLVVIPLSFVILLLGLFTLVISPIPIVFTYSGIALKWSVMAINEVVLFIDSLPFAVTDQVRFTLLNAFASYFVIAMLLLLFEQRKSTYLFVAFSTIVLMISVYLIEEVQLSKQRKLIIYHIPKHSAINLIDGEDNILISDFSLKKDKLKYHVENNWINKGVESEKVLNIEQLKKEHQLSNIYKISNENVFIKKSIFQFYNTKFVIIDRETKAFEPKQKLKLDYVIWSNNSRLSLKKLAKMYQFKLLIIDSSNSSYTVQKLIDDSKELNIKCWSLSQQGAYEIDI